MNEKEFQFKIMPARSEVAADSKYQYVCIFASYPTFVYNIRIKVDSDMARQDQLELAIQSLKMRLIKDIVNAKFEEQRD